MFRTPWHTSEFKLIKIILNVASGLSKRIKRKQMTESIFIKEKKKMITAIKIGFPYCQKINLAYPAKKQINILSIPFEHECIFLYQQY